MTSDPCARNCPERNPRFLFRSAQSHVLGYSSQTTSTSALILNVSNQSRLPDRRFFGTGLDCFRELSLSDAAECWRKSQWPGFILPGHISSQEKLRRYWPWPTTMRLRAFNGWLIGVDGGFHMRELPHSFWLGRLRLPLLCCFPERSISLGSHATVP